MALFSGDLMVIQDSILKIGDKIARDYVELENLQNSFKGSNQFAAMLVEFIEKRLFEYFKDKKPYYDIVFRGDDVSKMEFRSDSRYVIDPIAGVANLIHAIPYFSTSIALQRRDKDGEFKTTSGIIDNPVTQETFIVEDGRGAYVNSRRIRVSSRSKIDEALIVIENNGDKKFILDSVEKYKNIIITANETLNICNVANGKYDATIIQNETIFHELPLLLIKESGGLIKKLDDSIVICNDFLHSHF